MSLDEHDGATSRSPTVDLALFGSLLLVVPWTVPVYTRGPVTLVFPWGLASVTPFSAIDLYSYLFVYTGGLPDWLVAWPLGSLLLVLAAASATAGHLLGREDPRVTAGLLALSGVAALVLAWGFSGQPGRVGLPTGAVACWLAAWWRDPEALWALFGVADGG